MAKITTAKRKALSRSEFGLPAKAKKGPRGGAPRGAFPIDTKARAQNAKARAQQQLKAGNITKAERDEIFRRANSVLRTKGAQTLTTAAGRKVKVGRK